MPKQGIPVNREKIKNLRINLGFTQTELGGIAMEKNQFKKISLRTVQKIENDSNYLCSLKIIDNLSKVFDVPINELLMDEIFEDPKELDDKGFDPLIDEKSPEKTEILSRDLTSNAPKPSATPEKRLAPDVDQATGEVTSSADNQDDDNNLEIDIDREFYITEHILDRLEEHWESDQAFGHELWEYNPEKGEVLRNLTKFKFKPTSFDSLCKSVGDLDKSVYRIFEKHSYIPDHNTIHFRDEWDQDPVTGEMEYKDSGYRFDKGVNDFFKWLSGAHFYSIDYDLPEDEETLEIMYQLISRIENYFEKKISVAEELKFKYHFTSLKKQLYSKNISIFCSTRSSKKVGIGKNHGQVYLKAFHMRILIKNWSHPDVKDLQNCRDRMMHSIADTFTKVAWRDFLEIEKKEDE